ncbi:MAG: hypothetical protein EA376_01720, partial [Phycisphaeraceae bacterium]
MLNRKNRAAAFTAACILIAPAAAQTTELVSVSSTGEQANSWSSWPSISADGRYVAFDSNATNLVPGVSNNALDIYVHDRQTGVTERVSVSSTGGLCSIGGAEIDSRCVDADLGMDPCPDAVYA